MQSITTSRDLPHGRISLKGNLDQQSVMQAWPSRNKDLVNITGLVTLDLEAVEHVDSAGLAWILAIKKQCQQHNLQMTCENIPAGLLRLAKISDVEALLSLQ